jgi:hypothetical protein
LLPVVFFVTISVAPTPCFAQSTRTIDCPDGTVCRDVRKDGGRWEFCELAGSLKVQHGRPGRGTAKDIRRAIDHRL